MSDKVPVLSANELAKALKRLGFICKRQQGSHMFFEHPDGRTTVIPNHPGEDLDRGLLQKILKHDVQVSVRELKKNL